MIVIGERINSTRGSIQKALADNNFDFLMDEAGNQLDSKAEFIDINTAASLEKEEELLTGLVNRIQDKFDCGICIDSPDSKVIKSALKICRKKPFINSVSGESKRLALAADFAKERKSFIIALAMDDNGMPDDVKKRVAVAESIVSFAVSNGFDKSDIFIDPLAKPVSTEPKQAGFFLETVKILKDEGISCTGGLSNVSFGLPKRELLNAAFLKLAIDAGIGAAIIDPMQPLVNDVLEGNSLPEEVFQLAKAALLGEDEYSMNYIKAFREGRLTLK